MGLAYHRRTAWRRCRAMPRTCNASLPHLPRHAPAGAAARWPYLAGVFVLCMPRLGGCPTYARTRRRDEDGPLRSGLVTRACLIFAVRLRTERTPRR